MLTETKTITERDVVERERAAFVAGAALFGVLTYGQGMAAEREAAARYALPKVMRPRVETDQYGDEWKYEIGRDGDECAFYWRSPHNPTGDWTRADKLDAAIVPTIARLIAQPTEEVTP